MTTYLPINTVLGRMATLGRAMDDAFGPSNGDSALFTPATNAVASEHAYELTFDLPGVAADAVEITFERNVLSVRGKRTAAMKEGAQLLFAERPVGTFVRTLRFPSEVEGDKISAAFKDGVLTITIPKAEIAKPRRISVN